MAKGARNAASASTVTNNNMPEDNIASKKLVATSGPGRSRKSGANGTGTGKDSSANAMNGTQDHGEKLSNGVIGGINGNLKDQSPWHASPRPTLHLYRRTYRLSTPSSYASPRASTVLSHGIGKLSPSMARPRAKQRVPKETLALAVRKHFNALPVNENEAVVNTLYKARTNEKHLRLRFPATRPDLKQGC